MSMSHWCGGTYWLRNTGVVPPVRWLKVLREDSPDRGGVVGFGFIVMYIAHGLCVSIFLHSLELFSNGLRERTVESIFLLL